ncbi:MAG: hypothetical protein SOW94_02245, partial [Erysipelotrichaceae bacterium]|nr:hypothetical protein [Erysipelotrichaceae bacterium]
MFTTFPGTSISSGLRLSNKAADLFCFHLGFFIMFTSEEMTASDALTKYRHRASIEKLFRLDKAFFGMNALRVGSEASLESKALLSF